MRTFLKSGNAKLYLYLCILAVLAVLWRIGETINIQLGTLPVKVAPKAGNNSAVLSEKSFYPVWVKQAVARAPVTDEGPVDSLFKREEEKVVDKVIPTEPDYGQMFRQAIRIDGVADDGLFINGHFYTVGAKLEELAVTTAAGKRIVPRLASLANGKATFEVGTQKITTVHAKESS